MFKVGDYVRVRTNAPGTAWEYGKIEAIKGNKAILSFGAPNLPQHLRILGAELPHNMDELEPLNKAEV